MTTDVALREPSQIADLVFRLRRAAQGRTLPILTVLTAIMVVWYLAAIGLNRDRAIDRLEDAGASFGFTEVIGAAWSLERPVLPTPTQIAGNIWDNTIGVATSRYEDLPTAIGRFFGHRRSLVYHTWVTMASTLVGFALGTGLGILLAVGIVHVLTLERSLMPWVIASQTVPILAIAPMIVVVLGNAGLTGLWPKAVISAYLSFFPVTIGMVKGLRAADPLQRDLMRTYSASGSQVFWMLRWPSSISFLFPSLKIGVALSLVGAIVGELPTGAQAGLGARLLSGSYYGQMVSMWAALILSALLAMLLIAAVSLTEKLVIAARGDQP